MVVCSTDDFWDYHDFFTPLLLRILLLGSELPFMVLIKLVRQINWVSILLFNKLLLGGIYKLAAIRIVRDSLVHTVLKLLQAGVFGHRQT